MLPPHPDNCTLDVPTLPDAITGAEASPEVEAAEQGQPLEVEAAEQGQRLRVDPEWDAANAPCGIPGGDVGVKSLKVEAAGLGHRVRTLPPSRGSSARRSRAFGAVVAPLPHDSHSADTAVIQSKKHRLPSGGRCSTRRKAVYAIFAILLLGVAALTILLNLSNAPETVQQQISQTVQLRISQPPAVVPAADCEASRAAAANGTSSGACADAILSVVDGVIAKYIAAGVAGSTVQFAMDMSLQVPDNDEMISAIEALCAPPPRSPPPPPGLACTPRMHAPPRARMHAPPRPHARRHLLWRARVISILCVRVVLVIGLDAPPRSLGLTRGPPLIRPLARLQVSRKLNLHQRREQHLCQPSNGWCTLSTAHVQQ